MRLLCDLGEGLLRHLGHLVGKRLARPRTGVGAGYAIVCSPLAVSNGITPSFAASALLMYLS